MPETKKGPAALQLMKAAPFIKTLLFTLVVPGSVAGWIPLFWLVPGRPLWRSPASAVGWVLVAAGSAVYLLCAFDFSKVGEGTPAPIDAPKKLVSGRLYQITRNPMYVGVLAVLFGEAIVFRSAVLLRYAIAVGISFHFFVVLYEEPTLRSKFGQSYRDYCEQVPRWFRVRR